MTRTAESTATTVSQPGRHLATLVPHVRLVVLRFLVKSSLVPECVPDIAYNRVTPSITGKEIMPSTPNVWLSELRTRLLNKHGVYMFVGARSHKRPDGKSDVRFTFCHKAFINKKPNPNFAANFNTLANFLVALTRNNVWTAQAFINPFFEENGTTNSDGVFMLTCASRKPVINENGSLVTVHEGGRQKMPSGYSLGLGPRIPLLNMATSLSFTDNRIQLIPPVITATA